MRLQNSHGKAEQFRKLGCQTVSVRELRDTGFRIQYHTFHQIGEVTHFQYTCIVF